MKSQFLSIPSCILILFFLSSNYIFCQKKNNNILIIDNTKSMIGFNGSKDIWKNVKDYIIQFVDTDVRIGEEVTVYTFATKLSSPITFAVNSKKDKELVKNYINSLEASGLTTCIANALENSIADLHKNRDNYILLFTDGNENCTSDFNSLKSQYNIHKSDVKDIYFIPFNPSVLSYEKELNIHKTNPNIKHLHVKKPTVPKKTFNIEIK